MRAIVLHERGTHGPRLTERAVPERPADGVLVRMLAASVNRVDLYMRDSGQGITHDLPLVMGVDGVGEVLESGPGSAFRAGDRVILYPYDFCGRCRHCLDGDQPLCLRARIFGEHIDGTFTEVMAVPERALLPLSPAADLHAAATLGVAYLTAWRMVLGRVPAGPGQVVFIQGAGGGVAHAALQLARMAGARVIVSTTGPGKLAHFQAEGVAAVDYRDPEMVAQVLALTGGAGADMVIDNVGAASWAQSLRVLGRGGQLMTCGATTGAHPSADIQRLFVRQLSVHGSTMGSLEEFRRLLAAFESGAFRPPIDSVFPLAEVPAAFARLEAAERLGKIVIDIADLRGAEPEATTP